MTKHPQLYRTIIALIKFADIPAIPAIGYAAQAKDESRRYPFRRRITRRMGVL